MSQYSISSNENSTPAFKPLPPEAQFSKDTSEYACPTFDSLCAFLEKWSPRSYDGFYEGVALFLLSTIAARRVSFDLGKTRYTNLQIMLIGRTGISAKSSVASIASEILHKAGMGFFLIPDLITPQKLVNLMAIHLPEKYDQMTPGEKELAAVGMGFSGQRGWYHDEFGATLSAMMRSESTNALFRGLFRRFDDADEKFQLAGIIRGIDEIDQPYLSFLGCLTIADLLPFCGPGSSLWGDGFLARFALITSDDNLKKGLRFPKSKRIIPPDLLKKLVDWHVQLGMPKVLVQPKVTIIPALGQHLEVSESVEDAFYSYGDALLEIMETQTVCDLDGNYVRFAEKAIRIAAIFASLSGANTINLGHWAKAQEITESWRKSLHTLYRQLVTRTPPRKTPIPERVFRVIVLKGNPNRREIEQHTGLTSSEVQEALIHLCQIGQIQEVNCETTIRYELVSKTTKEVAL